VQEHAARFIAQTEASNGAELPRFLQDEFDAFLECGILAHGCPSRNPTSRTSALCKSDLEPVPGLACAAALSPSAAR
jgi:hypothetical protein